MQTGSSRLRHPSYLSVNKLLLSLFAPNKHHAFFALPPARLCAAAMFLINILDGCLCRWKEKKREENSYWAINYTRRFYRLHRLRAKEGVLSPSALTAPLWGLSLQLWLHRFTPRDGTNCSERSYLNEREAQTGSSAPTYRSDSELQLKRHSVPQGAPCISITSSLFFLLQGQPSF